VQPLGVVFAGAPHVLEPALQVCPSMQAGLL